jgi:hypothetical protein
MVDWLKNWKRIQKEMSAAYRATISAFTGAADENQQKPQSE